MVSLIAAIGKNRELGKDNKLLWHIPADLKRFKKLTLGKIVIMGRKTFESLPKKSQPLPNRTNVVITHNKNWSHPKVLVFHSLEEALKKLKKEKEIFIIGGASIFQKAINYADRIYLTVIDKGFPEADVFFPDYSNFSVVKEEKKKDKNYSFSFLVLEKREKFHTSEKK